MFFLAQAHNLKLQLLNAFFLEFVIESVCMELPKPAAAHLPPTRQHQGNFWRCTHSSYSSVVKQRVNIEIKKLATKKIKENSTDLKLNKLKFILKEK
jgi:hypothetical protein